MWVSYSLDFLRLTKVMWGSMFLALHYWVIRVIYLHILGIANDSDLCYSIMSRKENCPFKTCLLMLINWELSQFFLCQAPFAVMLYWSFQVRWTAAKLAFQNVVFRNIILYYPCCAILCWVVVKIMRGLTKWSISRSIFSLASGAPSDCSIHLCFLRAQEPSQLAGAKAFHLLFKNTLINWIQPLINVSKTKLLSSQESHLLSLVKNIFHLFWV